MPATPIFDDAQVIKALTYNGLGLKWTGSEIKYNFHFSVGGTYWHLNARQQSMAEYWMGAWNDLVAVRITRVGDDASTNIDLANETREDISYVNTTFSVEGVNALSSASVVFNDLWGDQLSPENGWPSFYVSRNLITPTFGNYGAMAYGHEIGHTLGLSHPGNYNGSGAATAASTQDSQQYTIMSYFSASTTGAQHAGHYAQTPLMDDILAIQSLYGINLNTRSDATVYGFHSSLAGSVYDFSLNAAPILCIYDAGGNDTLDLSGYTTGSRISLVAGSFSDAAGMTGNISIARGVTIENATGGSGNDSLTGNAAANILVGGNGSDTLMGGDGNDILDGGAGVDALSGGQGDDKYVIDNAGDTVTELAGQGTDMAISSISYTLGAEVENLTLTGTAAINGTGNALNNVLVGNAAANILMGGDGNDVLDGGTGADALSGGQGDDKYVIDNTGDTVAELAGQGTDMAISSISYTLGAEVENLTLTGTAAINGMGNALNNVLVGNAAANILMGGDGNDVLDGGTGADALSGGQGDDKYVIDNTGDTVTELAGQGTDMAISSISYTLGAEVENLTLTGTAVINGMGNALNNVLVGNAAANILVGGAGDDKLIGGAGNDTFVLGRGYGNDTIQEDDATTGNSDTALLEPGVAKDQLWFRKMNNNLEVSIIGTTDRFTVSNWYLGKQYQVEQFRTADGSCLLGNMNVDKLVSAMAAFAPPSAGQTTLFSAGTAYANLSQVITSAWTPSS